MSLKTRLARGACAFAAAAMMVLPLAPSARAQETPAPPPAEAPAEAPAEEAAPPPTLEATAADAKGFVAYLNNTDPAGTSAAGVAGPGHNAWLMASAALVLFMTLPGLFLFYGGLVRSKNVLSVVAQCFGCAGLVTILWVTVGYTLVFGEGGSPFIGTMKHAMFKDVGSAPDTNYCYWVSENVFAMFQMMFAIITPALIVGAIAERMKFTAIMAFIAIWMFVVYFPLAHMVWGVDGLMNGVWNGAAKIKAIDFAGGTVVHMSSGWSALVLCMILGPRTGFKKDKMAPHSMVLCAVGTGMLWVGWYGFNAGSALASDGIAAQAFTTTTVAAATASFVWALVEKITRGHASILGFCSGAVAGLVVITPAAGFVTVQSSLIMGVLAGVIPYLFCTKIKNMLGYDDSLDTFGVHAVGGTLGAILTGVFADEKVNPNLVGGYATTNGLADIVAKKGVWIEQLKAVGVTLALSIVATVVIAMIIKVVIGLRPSVEDETVGLDLTDHGEQGYEH
jgi:Amt family ammonium transporter